MMLRVVDLETCGFEPPAGVCEIGFCDLVRDEEGWHVGVPGHLLIDPGSPIPPETSAVHHITDADVIGAPSFEDAARAVFFDEERDLAPRVVLVAHNARFERQWLTPEVTGEVHWICTYKAALRVWPDAPSHSNGALRYWLKPEGLQPRQRWPKERVVEKWIGISLDEAIRMKPSWTSAIENRWPLIELRMNRRDCLAWLDSHGYPLPPKSACTFCPFRRDAEWRRMRDEAPEEFADAVAIDHAIRAPGHGRRRGEAFIHQSLKPLDQVDLSTAAERGQPDLFLNECEGMCGV